MLVIVRARQFHAVDPAQQLVIALRDLGAKRKYLVQLLELPEPECRAHVAEAIVEAESHVLEPAAGVATALVPQRAQQPPLLLRVRRDHAALAGRHLLVRIERKDGAHAVRTDPLALVAGAERLARILNEREAVLRRDRAQRVELAGISIDVD